MSEAASATDIARQYYDSDDADRFYALVWGGEDIHVGLYEADDEPIASASQRTVKHLCERLSGLSSNLRILDLGSGYGGAARYLASTYGCRITCLNLSEVENDRNRELNEQAGLADRIEVIEGSFEEIPGDSDRFDIVWSQDAILHSGKRMQVFREVDRVLISGGRMILTDPMQSDSCPDGVLQPILDRLHLPDLGSPSTYQNYANELGWSDLGFENHTHQLVRHYTRVLQTMESLEDSLSQQISPGYMERMKRGLNHWIVGGKEQYLAWGVFLFQK